jgi:hypothetical protein
MKKIQRTTKKKDKLFSLLAQFNPCKQIKGLNICLKFKLGLQSLNYFKSIKLSFILPNQTSTFLTSQNLYI